MWISDSDDMMKALEEGDDDVRKLQWRGKGSKGTMSNNNAKGICDWSTNHGYKTVIATTAATMVTTIKRIGNEDRNDNIQ